VIRRWNLRTPGRDDEDDDGTEDIREATDAATPAASGSQPEPSSSA
jgi:hypothetical protein